MTIYEKLSAIQEELSVPKEQENKFGGYLYRSCEDILEKVKPLCKKYNAVLFLSDTLVEIGGRNYVKAEATLLDLEDENWELKTTAFAREEEKKTGMDGSQITGASSSYARKYALNGLFCIDDVKDSDFTNTGDKPKESKRKQWPDSVVEGQPKPAANALVCSQCGAEISQKVYDYSVSGFKRPLCYSCQKNAH